MWGTKTETIPVIVGASGEPDKRKYKKDFEDFKRRNHPGNRTMQDDPHSSENIINSTNKIRAFISKESGRDLEEMNFKTLTNI